LVAIRHILSAENRRRDVLKARGQDQPEYGYLETAGPDGQPMKQKVELALLDLTDKENLAFRYPL
jgi:hypothetical protein